MRYLAEPFALSALRRGLSISQFLGPLGSAGRWGVRHVEVRPVKTGYEVYLHDVEDGGLQSGTADLVEFGAFEPVDDEEYFGARIASSDDLLGALTVAEELTGAFRDRWVNQSMIQDEYNDFVQSGRPTACTPEGRPWPSRCQGVKPSERRPHRVHRRAENDYEQ